MIMQVFISLKIDIYVVHRVKKSLSIAIVVKKSNNVLVEI